MSDEEGPAGQMDDDAVVENNEQDGNESDKDDEADKSSSDEEVTSIHDCVRREDVEDLEKLLADPAKKKEINKIKKIYGEQLTPLELAVQDNSVEIVKLLVKNGADIDTKNEKKQTPLHRAVGCSESYRFGVDDKKRAGIVEFFLSKGLDGNARDGDNKTPLFYAVIGGRNKCCCALLRDEKLDARIMKERFDVKDHHSVPDTRDPLTLLELAVRTCSVATVKLLVEKGSDVNSKSQSMRLTPLHIAAQAEGDDDDSDDEDEAATEERAGMIEFLLAAGADMNARDKDSKTPLCWAVLEGKDKNAQTLLRHDGLDKKVFKERYNDTYEKPMTLLEHAISKCTFDTVKMLVDKGADVNSKSATKVRPLHIAAGTSIFYSSRGDDQEKVIEFLIQKGAKTSAMDSDKLTPLHHAARDDNEEACKVLLRHDKLTDPKVIRKMDQSPLHLAADRRNTGVARILLEHGADPSHKDSRGRTPFHLALESSYGDTEMARDFLRVFETKDPALLASMLGDKDDKGNTVLHLTAKNGNAELAAMLIEKGAKVDEPNSDRNTPIHLAAEESQSEVLQLLLKRPVRDINAVNDKQETALHKAAGSGDKKCVELLLKKGADVNRRDYQNNTPLWLAAMNQHQEVATLLQRNCCDASIIFEAAKQNKEDVLETLLAYRHLKKMINNKDEKGLTALHIASKRGYLKIVTCLLKHNAEVHVKDGKENLPASDVNHENKRAPPTEDNQSTTSEHFQPLWSDKESSPFAGKGWTPLHYASVHGHAHVVRVLIQHDRTVVDDLDVEGKTAFHLAAENGRDKVLGVLKLKDERLLIKTNKDGQSALHLAASKGWRKTCTLLLGYSQSLLDAEDTQGMTPLHLAAKDGHPTVIQLLLDKGTKILPDKTGLNYFDHAIDNGHMDVVKMIISSDKCYTALRNANEQVDGSIDTPMRKLIREMPKMAKLACDRCIERQTDKSDIHVYEFLDDTYPAEGWKTTTKARDGGGKTYGKDQQLTREAEPYTDNSYIRKQNHPLMIMLKHERQELFKHPVVKSLMKSKWHWSYRSLYIFSLFMYCVFLAALTGFLITADHPQSMASNSLDCVGVEMSHTFEKIAAYTVMVLAVVNILIEMFQFYMARRSYVTQLGTNLFDWVTSITAFIFVFSASDCHLVTGYRTEWQWHFGAIAIFFGWVNLVLYVTQMVPLLGIYVVMFTHTVITFAKFFFVAIIFTVAFALAFYTVLHQEGPFEDVAKSLLKTWVMMIGELDFDNIFNDSSNPPAFPVLAYILFVFFLIIMSILIMNLLVGLAVGDIQAVQNKATLTRLETEVELILDVELFTPRFLLHNTVMRQKEIKSTGIGCCQWIADCWSGANRRVGSDSTVSHQDSHDGAKKPDATDTLTTEEKMDELWEMKQKLEEMWRVTQKTNAMVQALVQANISTKNVGQEEE